jgi:hypothetical protein
MVPILFIFHIPKFWDVTESYLGLNELVLSDTSVVDTSDSDYVPGGRSFIPETVRRTTRQHGWTPGMYYEP